MANIHIEPQVWVLFKRPKNIPEITTEKDWPGRFVARRFERSADNLLYPTPDLLHAKTLADLQRQLPYLECAPRTPEDHETIIETRICPNLIPAIEGDKLSSGMRVSEAMNHASGWWERMRHAVDTEFNKQRDAAKVSGGKGSPLTISEGDVRDVLPSGILRGLPWAQLGNKEQVKVMLAWHHETHVKPGQERKRGFVELLIAGEVKSNA